MIRRETGQRRSRVLEPNPCYREQEGETTVKARGLYRSYVLEPDETCNCFDLASGIKSSSTPYSKAQKRRFNRKQREQLGGGLGSIEAVISALEEEEIVPPAERDSNAASSQQPPQAKARSGIIGEGKDAPLTKAQRKRVLCVLNSDVLSWPKFNPSREMERLRHPLILTDPHYAAHPFQTIRTHAQNTLEKRPGMPPV